MTNETVWGEGALTKVAAMTHEELQIRLLDAWEAIESLEERVELAESEVMARRNAAVLLAAGLDKLSALATDAKPQEYETIFRDYAPWTNLCAHFFPKEKKVRGKK